MTAGVLPVGRPRAKNWTKIVTVAAHRILGASREAAATACGVSLPAIKRWEASPWWGLAQQEAREQYMDSLAGKARKGLIDHVLKDGRLALSVLERLEPALAPPTQHVELKALLLKIDVGKLPDWAIDCLADGESPVSVVMRMTEPERQVAGLLTAGDSA